jgi:4-hydroxymandelate oxidase
MGDERHFDRRSLLRHSALLGGGGLAGTATLPVSASPLDSAPEGLTARGVLAKARERLAPTCRVCQVCDGVACSGDGGGIAGAGSGMSFQNNFTALRRVRLLPRTVHDTRKADPSTTILGHRLSFPAVAAPMGPAATRFGKGIPVEEWFESLIGGCVAAGTLGSIADDPRYPFEDVKARLAILARHRGKALYNSKPAANSIILKFLPAIEEAGAAWLSIDTDSGPKSAAELRELVKVCKIPIVVKGVMTADDAARCAEAGAAGIAVSNHGGRRLDHTPGVAEVLPAVASSVKGKLVILADGCVQSGADVLKYLALGADAVMVGRHLLRAAYGGGAAGVELFMNTMKREFESAMVLTGVRNAAEIDLRIVSVAGG